jgi:hypothetical protein
MGVDELRVIAGARATPRVTVICRDRLARFLCLCTDNVVGDGEGEVGLVGRVCQLTSQPLY